MYSFVRTLMFYALLLVPSPQVSAQTKDAPAGTPVLADKSGTAANSVVNNVPKKEVETGKPGKPTEEQCKEVYPDGALVTGVAEIDRRDIYAKRQPAKDAPNKNKTMTKQGEKTDPPQVQLREGLEITVTKLPELTLLQECPNKPRTLVLFLGGHPMPGLTAYPPTNPNENKIVFLLERKKENQAEWTDLLGSPAFHPMTMSASIGFDNSYAVKSDKTIEFSAIPLGWSLVWLAIMVGLAFVMLFAAKHTAMLRDGPDVNGAPAMFSLARVQMAFWTFLILASYAFVGMITGDYLNSMNGNVLALMGISTGALLGSSIIDSGVSDSNARSVLRTTKSWWRDILHDGKGISIHRFQMAAWTLVLGIVFLHEVYSNLGMPEFGQTLLGLLGISAGTYLGLKVVIEGPSVTAAAPGNPAKPADA